MGTEYCNKCGLLHNPFDGDCLGCKQQEIINELKKDITEFVELGTDQFVTEKILRLEKALKFYVDDELERMSNGNFTSAIARQALNSPKNNDIAETTEQN